MNNNQEPICTNGTGFFVVKKISQHDIAPYRNLITQTLLAGDIPANDPKPTSTNEGGDRS